MTQLCLRRFLILFLAPLPQGVRGEDLDFHFSEEVEGFGADSGPDPVDNIF